MNVTINSDVGLIEINHNGVNTILKLEDIKIVEIHIHKGLFGYDFDLDYAKYIFNDGEFFIVTSFMADGYYIPAGIKPVITKYFLPVIRKQAS